MSFRHVCSLFEQYDSNLPVTLSHNKNKKNFLGEGHQDFGTPPPKKKMLGTPIWPDMWVQEPRLKNPSTIPELSYKKVW